MWNTAVMRAALQFFISIVTLFSLSAHSCDDWFRSLKIKDAKTCESECRIAMVDMSSYMCHQQCDILCKSLGKPHRNDPNFYGLTDDEIKFCSQNKLICLKAYKLTWTAEGLCKEVYGFSDVNDETDACRHYIWAFLLSKEINIKNAEAILSAHENNQFESKNEKSMDLANNRLGQIDYEKNKDKDLNNKFITELFKENLKNNKLIILKPKYQKTGGLP